MQLLLTMKYKVKFEEEKIAKVAKIEIPDFNTNPISTFSETIEAN
jgi:hypothetical protein